MEIVSGVTDVQKKEPKFKIKRKSKNVTVVASNDVKRKMIEVEKKIVAVKINQTVYYNNKDTFMKKYKKLGLRWKENIGVGKVDGWFNKDDTKFLLKLPEEGEYKRFKGNCEEMIEFLISIGGFEFLTEEKGYHRQDVIEKREPFIGADLDSHHRFEKMLKDVQDNWGVIWK